ncbi:MAG: DUF1501 domain-containing protein [Zavarzinella sp.]
MQPETMMHRRNLLQSFSGLAGIALLDLLNAGKVVANPKAKAKRAIQISLVGGLSHLDSFDYKPELTKMHGKTLKMDHAPDIFFGQIGRLRQSDFAFQQHGNSGLWLSNLFPNIAKHADKLTVIRSMFSETANHTPGLFLLNSGFGFNGYPSLGSWLSYGMGAITDELPTYVVLPDGRGDPTGGASNWTSGFLPSVHQGVAFQSGNQPVQDLHPRQAVPASQELAAKELLGKLNQQYGASHPMEDPLLSRIASYQLAAKMQLAIPKVADLSQEDEKTKQAYGIHNKATQDCGIRCLLARRLLEKGTRYIQIYSGGPIGGSPRTSWDAHENVKTNHQAEAERIDQPIAALLHDLHNRGLLEDTLVLFTTEFGRTPFAQSAANVVGTGRDHNRYGFSCWMAGAGLKPGIAYGTTDNVGWKAAENPVSWHDFHATVLHLLGLDHEKLTFYHNGIQRRLTNVHGELVKGILG